MDILQLIPGIYGYGQDQHGPMLEKLQVMQVLQDRKVQDLQVVRVLLDL